MLFEFLATEQKLPKESVAEILCRDWRRGGRRDAPDFLREFLPQEILQRPRAQNSSLPKRQARHLAAYKFAFLRLKNYSIRFE